MSLAQIFSALRMSFWASARVKQSWALLMTLASLRRCFSGFITPRLAV